MGTKKVRDLTLFSLSGEDTLVIACDTCGAIGEKIHDVLRIPPFHTGKFTARVALMEVLATGARIIGVVNGACCEMNPTGRALIAGILEELRVAGIEESVLTGSTEENFPVSLTALAVTAIGLVPNSQLKINKLESGALLVAVGIPKVGQEVSLDWDAEIIQYSDLARILAAPEVLEIVPVGSKGIKYEIETLCQLNNGQFVQADRIKLDLNKSAGPATAAVVGIRREGLPLLTSLSTPVNILGYFMKAQGNDMNCKN